MVSHQFASLYSFVTKLVEMLWFQLSFVLHSQVNENLNPISRKCMLFRMKENPIGSTTLGFLEQIQLSKLFNSKAGRSPNAVLTEASLLAIC